MSEELPEGWAKVRLHELTEHTLGGDWGKGPEDHEAGAVQVGVVRGTEFKSWRTQKALAAATRFIKPSSLEKRRLEPGDLVVEVSGGGPQQPVGRTLRIDDAALASFPNPLICSNFCRQLRIAAPFDSAFVEIGLRHYYATGALEQIQTSTTNLRNLDFNAFLALELPVSPLPEQHRIVEKVEALLEQVSRAKERLDRVPLILKRFRQAVLAAACSGDLTREWRLSQSAASGAKVCSHGIELPQSWHCDVMSSAADYVGGFAFKSNVFSKHPTNHQVIRIGNVRSRRLDLSAAPVFIDDEEALRAQRFRLEPGDVVISMTGTRFKRDYGHPAPVPEGLHHLYLNQRIARLRPKRNCTSSYLTIWMETDLFRDVFFAGETGNVNQGNVGADAVKLGPIHLPSVEEQVEVARQVDGLLALADIIERRLQIAAAHTQKLPQSILSKAFSGELVPTEAELARMEGRSYESAEELLKRVAAASSEDPAEGKGRGRRGRKAG